MQLPSRHASAWVQALPSLHEAPSATIGFEHEPVPGSHVPAVWHWSDAAQTFGFTPVHEPAVQVSVCVQALPSLHAVPFGAAGFEQTPVVRSHDPTMWHWSEAVQMVGVVPVQVPAWQMST